MKLSAILAPLVAAGIDAVSLLKAVEAWEDQQTDALERRRASDRERQERRRHVMSRDVTVTVSSHDASVTRVEDNLQTKKMSGQKEKQEAAPKALSDLSAFKADLQQDATPEQVEAFAKHRKAKNGQNSAYAARLFRRDAAACGISVSEAIDTAISRGWLTVKPEYLVGRQARSSPSQSTKGRSIGQQFRDEYTRLMETEHAPGKNSGHHIDGDTGPGFAGTNIARRIALAASGRTGH